MKTFDAVYYLPVPKNELSVVESFFIEILKPKYNYGERGYAKGKLGFSAANFDVAVLDRYRSSESEEPCEQSAPAAAPR